MGGDVTARGAEKRGECSRAEMFLSVQAVLAGRVMWPLQDMQVGSWCVGGVRNFVEPEQVNKKLIRLIFFPNLYNIGVFISGV